MTSSSQFARDAISNQFDAIIVGARIAGSALAYQLARRGWRVALVEQQPAELGPALSVPVVYPRAFEQFRRLDLLPVLDEVTQPLTPLHTVSLRLDNVLVLSGTLPAWAGFDAAHIIPRPRLDNALLTYVLQQHYPAPGHIAFLPGHRVVELIRVSQHTTDGTGNERGDAICGVQLSAPDRAPSSEMFAPLVIGADGRFSSVAHLLGQAAAKYDRVPPTTSFCFRYCRGIQREGLADGFMARGKDGRTVLISEIEPRVQLFGIYLPADQYPSFRGQHTANRQQHTWDEFLATAESIPELSGRLDRLEPVGKVWGLSPQTAEGYFRPAGGPGWALVGDAAHFKDPSSSQGIHDALYTVSMLLEALDEVSGGKPLTVQQAASQWPAAAVEVQHRRDQALTPMYDFTNTLSRLLTHPPSRKEVAMLRLMGDDPWLLKQFLGVFTGATDFGAFERSLPSYLVRRLLSHGLDLVGLTCDINYLFGGHSPLIGQATHR